MAQAARVGDRITHTNAYAGLIAGALAGAAIAALCVATGGLGAVAIAAAGGAGLGGVIGEFAAGFTTSDTGEIVDGSGDVATDGRRAARVGDPVTCSWHSGNQRIAEGSATVLADGRPAARQGDRTTCGAEIASGSGDVDVGGPTRTVLKVDPEVPLAAELIVGGLGLLSGAGEIALAADGLKLAKAAQLAKGLATAFGLGTAGSVVGGEVWGQGSRGQRQLTLGAGLFGAAASATLAGRADPAGVGGAPPGASAYPYANEPAMPSAGSAKYDFAPERPGGLDMNNLSPDDNAAAKAMQQGGWNGAMQKQVLDSGDGFGVRQGHQGEPMYKISTAGRDESTADPSAYFTDQSGFDDLQSRYYDDANDTWDSNGVKNGIALPCYNKADAFWQGSLNSDQPLVKSTTNPVTETVHYFNPDGSPSSTFTRYMQGGGGQVTPANGGVGGLAPYTPKGTP